MNREQKFRAKREDNKQWVYGHYAFLPKRKGSFGQQVTEHDSDRHVIISGHDHYVIDFKTLGQYINYKENKIEFYEGDIVDISFYEYPEQPREKLIETLHGKIVWDHYYLRFAIEKPGDDDCAQLTQICHGNSRLKLIGNVHDNPELEKNDDK